VGLADLSSILWREREILELLLFKLEEEQLILASGRGRWLAHATREVELVLEQVRGTEVVRAAEVEVIAAQLGLGPAASLAQVAAATSAPWSELLREHRDALLMLAAEVSGLAGANHDLLTAGQRAVRETMVGAVEPSGRDGAKVRTSQLTTLFDSVL
jgi:flagellar FlgN protein